MRTGITLEVTAADRTRLEAIAADRNSPQKHVWRANIVLLTAAGRGTAEIMRRTGKAKTCVWRWQERYMQEGVDGLLRDKTRPSVHDTADLLVSPLGVVRMFGAELHQTRVAYARGRVLTLDKYRG